MPSTVEACLGCTLPICDDTLPECAFVQITREPKREANRRWKAKNREAVREADRLRYAANREAKIASVIAYQKRNPQKRAEHQRRYAQNRKAKAA